ncbi:MAG: porin family protein [Candidatus Electrothrix sp. EH2]|nr:porin family protein [Candidatus Electrothrix sp. EH2]
MKKSVMMTVGLMALSYSSAVYSAPGPYLSINGGVGIADDLDLLTVDSLQGTGRIAIESKVGFAGSVSLGYTFTDSFRLEAELAYQENDADSLIVEASQTINGVTTRTTEEAEVDDTVTKSSSGLVNAYFDFPTHSVVTPFVSCGAGYAKVELEDSSDTFDDTAFAYQLGGGVSFSFNPSVSLDIKYRYFAVPSLELVVDAEEVDFASHNVYGGLRFTFY